MAQPLTAILFDYGGTLDSDGMPWLERFQHIYKEEGLRASAEDFTAAFHRADDSLPSRFDLAGQGLEKTILLQAGCVSAALAPAEAGLADRVARRFTAESRATLRRNRPLLERLARRFRLGIVSNFYGNLESILAGEGILELFGAVMDSQRERCIKPDREIFQRALDALGATPGSACMVGDSVRRDMRGAEALGMRHMWLAGAAAPAGRCCADAPVLRSLLELESCLEPEAAPAANAFSEGGRHGGPAGQGAAPVRR